MLGAGIYFAPNPMKSVQYSPDKRMILTKVNLDGSKYAQNKVFEEYCIYSSDQALPVFIITWDYL